MATGGQTAALGGRRLRRRRSPLVHAFIERCPVRVEDGGVEAGDTVVFAEFTHFGRPGASYESDEPRWIECEAIRSFERAGARWWTLAVLAVHGAGTGARPGVTVRRAERTIRRTGRRARRSGEAGGTA